MKLTKRGAAKLFRDAIEPTAPENDEMREHAAEIESDKILIPVITIIYTQSLRRVFFRMSLTFWGSHTTELDKP